MRLNLIFIIILMFASPLEAQTDYQYNHKQGYAFIKKAEWNLKIGNHSKAERLLAKVKKSNYGFCGNAWAIAYSRIAFMETQLLLKKEKYNQALSVLDSLSNCLFEVDCLRRDSLKIAILILKYGKEKVRTSFDKLTSANKEEDYFSGEYWVYLDDLKYKFSFFVPDSGSNNHKELKSEKSGNEFHDLTKDLPFYKLLK